MSHYRNPELETAVVQALVAIEPSALWKTTMFEHEAVLGVAGYKNEHRHGVRLPALGDDGKEREASDIAREAADIILQKLAA